MDADFRFTRHGCGLGYDVSVRLIADEAAAFSIALDPKLVHIHPPERLNAVLSGVRAAHSDSQLGALLAVTVVGVVDHSGSSGDLGFKICGEAAMYCLLGLPEKAPFPGYVLG